MMKQRQRLLWPLAVVALLSACASTNPTRAITNPEPSGRLACDSFFIYEMCVQDMSGDGRVDLMYFSDTNEIFMYRDGMADQVSTVLPLHRCAIPMDGNTVDYSSRLLYSDDLTLVAEMDVKGKLLANYLAAKPAVDACYAQNDAVSEAFGEEEDYDWSMD
jgi:hypothetical protein